MIINVKVSNCSNFAIDIGFLKHFKALFNDFLHYGYYINISIALPFHTLVYRETLHKRTKKRKTFDIKILITSLLKCPSCFLSQWVNLLDASN